MNFETTHSVHTNVFSTKIAFASFGVGKADGTDDENMSAAQEEALFEDLGFPKINLGDLTFSADFEIDSDKRVVIKEGGTPGTDCDTVKLIANAKVLEIGPDFAVEYSCDAANVPKSECGTVLTTKKLVAEAKCALFDKVVKDAIKKAIQDIKAEKTRFETDPIQTLSI